MSAATKPRIVKLKIAVDAKEAQAIRETSLGADAIKALAPVFKFEGVLEAGVFIDTPLTKEQAKNTIQQLPTAGPLHWLRYRIEHALAVRETEEAALPPPVVDVGAMQRTIAELAGELGEWVNSYRQNATAELKQKIDAVIAAKQLDAQLIYGVSETVEPLPPLEPSDGSLF